MDQGSIEGGDAGRFYRSDVEQGVDACRVITDLFPPEDAEVLRRSLDTADLFAAGILTYRDLQAARIDVEAVLGALAPAVGARERDGVVVEADHPELLPPYLAVRAVRAAVRRQPEQAQSYARQARQVAAPAADRRSGAEGRRPGLLRSSRRRSASS